MCTPENEQAGVVVVPGTYDFDLGLAFLEDLHPVYGTPRERGTSGNITLLHPVPLCDLRAHLVNEATKDSLTRYWLGERVEVRRFELTRRPEGQS